MLRKPLRDGAAISAIFEKQSNSILELPDFDAARTSLDDETRVLKREIRRVVSALYANGPDHSDRTTLHSRLEKFANAAT